MKNSLAEDKEYTLMGTRIHKIATYLPETILSNVQLEAEFPDWSSAKIEEKTGIQSRHVVKTEETALNLAVKAAEKLLNGYDRTQIDFLLYCTQSPEYYLPTGACILQDILQLNTSIGALDYNLGCSGYVYGLALAKSLIQGGIAQKVLLITSETYTKHIHPKDKANRTIFGDGAAATIIESAESDGIGEFVLGTDGRGAPNLIIPNGGMRRRFDSAAPELIDEAGNIRTHNHLFMKGPEIFNFTIQRVPEVVSETCARNHLTKDDLDYIIFHQANKYMLEYLRRKINIPKEKFHINLLHTGNTVSATIPIALKECLDGHKIQSGDKVLLIGFGVGYSWAGTIILV